MKCYTGGAGRPLLLLHGFGGSHKSMLPIIKYFERTRLVAAPDLPGFGESAEPSAPYSVSDYAADVIGLMDELGIDKIDIIAHSFGGRIALKLLARYPKRFGRAVLCGCAGLKPRRGAGYYIRVLWFKLMKRLKKVFKRIDLGKYGSSDYRSLSPGMKQTFKLVIAEDLSGELQNITAPALVVVGDGDTATPPYMARRIAKGICGAKLRIIKGCGHFCYLEALRDFLLMAEDFLEGR